MNLFYEMFRSKASLADPLSPHTMSVSRLEFFCTRGTNAFPILLPIDGVISGPKID
jgi:hypothetical protein